MTEEDKWQYLVSLDDELLGGGVILSEWCAAIVREADTAFVAGAHLGCVLTAVAGVETHLRSEEGRTKRLVNLIDGSGFSPTLCERLHALRKYRNSWVHVDEPWDDVLLLTDPQIVDEQLESFAEESVRLLREVIYSNPWI